MLQDTLAFSSFSVDDLQKAQDFYSKTLGITVDADAMGLILKPKGMEGGIFVYNKDDHAPATFTVLNFSVDNIDAAVDELSEKGVVFEQYPEMTDEKGVARGLSRNQGPDIAWFKDPAGNILAVLQQS